LGAKLRRGQRPALVAALLMGVLSLLTTNAAGSVHSYSGVERAAGKKHASIKRPSQILAGPAGLMAGATSAPDLTYWVLVHHHGATNIQLLDRLNAKVETVVPESSAADAVAIVPSGPLIVGRATATSGSVEFHSPQTGIVEANLPLSGPVKALAVSANGATIYALVVRGRTSSVAVISASNAPWICITVNRGGRCSGSLVRAGRQSGNRSDQ
jgi:hypothetical protein